MNLSTDECDYLARLLHKNACDPNHDPSDKDVHNRLQTKLDAFLEETDIRKPPGGLYGE